MQRSNRLMVVVLVIAGLPLSPCPRVLGAERTEHPARVERIEGTKLSRVTLTEKAIERIGLKTDRVREVNVSRKRIVGGEVVALTAASASNPSAPVPGTDPSKGETVYRQFAPGQVEASVQAPSEGPGRVAIRVRLPEGELKKVARGEPARILLPGRDDDDDDDDAAGLMARPVEMPAVGGPTERTAALHYMVDSPEHNLASGQRVRVRLALSGKGTKRKVVPYSALIYDPHGDTWVYTSPTPRTFVRHEVEVDYIEGDVAVLDEGPPAGTVVATVGVAELYGTEFKMGK